MEQLAFLQKRQKLRRQEAARTETHEPIDLFGGTPFGILAPSSQEGDIVERNDKVISFPASRFSLLIFLFRSWCKCGGAVLKEN